MFFVEEFEEEFSQFIQFYVVRDWHYGKREERAGRVEQYSGAAVVLVVYPERTV
jgi:hypothetical protein